MSDTSTNGNESLQKSLPSFYYRSQEIFEREKEQIFFKEWVCAGREEQLPNAGDFLVLDIVGESILVVRTKYGSLAAHYNVCRHRGARLCASDAEQLASGDLQLKGGVLGTTGIRCPYHQWTYGLDGKLLHAPHFVEGAGFCKSDFSLYPVGLETWGGFFFLNLSPGESAKEYGTLQQQLSDIISRVKRYPLDVLRSVRTITYAVPANWKAILENYNECYHCGGLHPELCEIVPAFRQQGGAQLDWEGGIPHREGASTFSFSGTTTRAPFPGLSEDEKVRHKGELIYPNFMLSLAADHVAAFLLWPKSAQETRITCHFLFHPDEIKKPGFAPEDAIEFWDLVNRQDWAICKRVQQGMNSRVHKFGYYAPMEDLSADIRRYVLEHLRPEK